MKNIKILVILVIISYYICNCDDCSSFDTLKIQSCESLSTTDGHKCYYNNGECSSVYNGCSAYSGSDINICNSIIPSNPINKCAIVDESCQEKPKECGDYKSGDVCENLSAGTNKRCIMNKGKCEAHYIKCADYTDDDDVDEENANQIYLLILSQNVYGIQHVKMNIKLIKLVVNTLEMIQILAQILKF